MTYDNLINDIVKVVEAVGAAIMVVGGFWALAIYCASASASRSFWASKC